MFISSGFKPQDLAEFEWEEYFVIRYLHPAVLKGVDQNWHCYYWPVHFVTGFHISIVTSIKFYRSPSQKDVFFL